jgi:deoxyhypusine synthase
MLATKRMGIFTVGGGVPRNWSQQFGRLRGIVGAPRYKNLPLKRYNYGLRICPEPVHWGGLSGSTYTEAVSWENSCPPEEGGQFAEVFERCNRCIATGGGAVLQRLGYFKR